MEIERKFFVKTLPPLDQTSARRYERYYLKISDEAEERIQIVDGKYVYEKLIGFDDLSRSSEKREISKDEFEILKASASRAIVRSGYDLGPGISIKIYHGDFEGLVRAEVEFTSKQDAEAYRPEAWMGAEITDTPLGRDSRLVGLPKAQFETLLSEYSA